MNPVFEEIVAHFLSLNSFFRDPVPEIFVLLVVAYLV